MRHHSNHTTLSIVVSTMFLNAALLLSGCELKPIPCLVSQGGYRTEFTVKKNDGGCEEYDSGVVQAAYHFGKAVGGIPDSENAAISLSIEAIQMDYNAAFYRAPDGLKDESEYDLPFGKFSDAYPSDDRCQVKKLSTQQFSFSEVPALTDPDEIDERWWENSDKLDADFYKVTWSDIDIDVSYDSMGIEFRAKLEVEQNCGVVEYDVEAVHIYPCYTDSDCDGLGATRELFCDQENSHPDVVDAGTCYFAK